MLQSEKLYTDEQTGITYTLSVDGYYLPDLTDVTELIRVSCMSLLTGLLFIIGKTYVEKWYNELRYITR